MKKALSIIEVMLRVKRNLFLYLHFILFTSFSESQFMLWIVNSAKFKLIAA